MCAYRHINKRNFPKNSSRSVNTICFSAGPEFFNNLSPEETLVWSSNYSEKRVNNIQEPLRSISIHDLASLNDDNENPKLTKDEKTTLLISISESINYTKYLLKAGKNPNFKREYLNDRFLIFGLVFTWFYHPKIGYYVFSQLKQNIKTVKEKEFFKEFFLSYQKFYQSAFFRHIAPITEFTYGLSGLFFSELNLKKTIK